MNVVRIAWRSIQHRGLGSLLTILSMALGVMSVVMVLSIHGIMSQSFRSNSSFGYSVLVGARGGGQQLTLSSVYYLTPPVENIPYEYYLAFKNRDVREQELKNSIIWNVHQTEQSSLDIANAVGGSLASALSQWATERQQIDAMGIEKDGLYANWTQTAIPLNLGDFWVDEETESSFRCVGTKPVFFNDQVLDIESGRKFSFADWPRTGERQRAVRAL